MPIEEHTLIVRIILGVLMALFVLGALGVIVTNVLIMLRTKALVIFPEEKSLSRWERKARQFNRSSTFFTDPRLKRLRLAMYASIGLSLSSFVLLILVDGLSR